ncbi:MAG: hypothetical protein ACI9FJ_002238 [Alteromonadaceae bacterium]|jgi:hypothetical protein
MKVSSVTQQTTKKSSIILKSAVVLLSTLGVMSFGTQANVTDSIAKAVKEGKTTLNLRYRYENVDQDNIDKTANSSTLKTRLTFQSGNISYVNFKLEVDNVTAIGNESYNSTKNGNSQYPVVADPTDTDINQAYLQYKNENFKLTAGRQRIVQNDQRFIGGVAWRQNEQTYDAYRFQFQVNKNLGLDYSYVHNVNRIFGPDSRPGGPTADLKGNIHLFNAMYQVNKAHKLAFFGYSMDFDKAHALSNDTFGLRYQGKFNNFGLIASYASQTDGGDHPIDYRANFMNLEGSLKVNKFNFGLGWQVLDADDGVGFQTPFATLHKWQGFADQFLGTPGTGIEDVYFKFATKIGPVAFKAHWHDLSASEGNGDWGDELDLIFAYKVNKNVSTLLKYSNFSADSGSGKVDIEKLWLMVNAKF